MPTKSSVKKKERMRAGESSCGVGEAVAEEAPRLGPEPSARKTVKPARSASVAIGPAIANATSCPDAASALRAGAADGSDP